MMLHGLGANRHNFDLFGHPDALPRQMARAGHHVYVVELRGVGLSRTPRADGRVQGVDAYLRHDLPAAVEYIRRSHSADRIHWVGHSLGAMLAYVYGAAFPEHLQSLVAAAGPVPALVKVPGLSLLLPIRHIIRGRMLGEAELPNRVGLQAIKRAPGLVRRMYDKILFYAENMPDDFLISFADSGLESVPLSVLRRLGDWVTRDGPYAGEIERALGGLHVPTLFLAARYDPLCQPQVVEEACRMMPTGMARSVIVSRETGFGSDFGHGDLLASENAIREVYPLILRYVAEQEARRRVELQVQA